MLRVALVLAILCAGLFAAGHWLGRGHRTAGAGHGLHTPDNSNYYLDGATVYQLDADGGLSYRMTARQILHFTDDSAQLSDIHVHYLQGTQTYWNLQAPDGHVPAGQHAIYLYGGVVIHHPRVSGDMVVAHTSHAWVRPRQHRIDSNAPVTATEPGQKVTGDGMLIDLKANTLNLLHNVHVNYEP